MGTKTAQQTRAHPPPSSTKVMRSYQVVLNCADQSQREEINRRIRILEERQLTLLTPQVVKKAVGLASLELGYDVQLEAVRPHHTSSLHHSCGGSLVRGPGQYNLAPCKKCGKKVNTHDNAALNIASLPGTLLPNDLFPSTHVRGPT
ncbi:MAG: zinc ribbon domain-containing protein [Candidatus Heimdallarchaeaceae archaeon]